MTVHRTGMTIKEAIQYFKRWTYRKPRYLQLLQLMDNAQSLDRFDHFEKQAHALWKKFTPSEKKQIRRIVKQTYQHQD